MGRCGSPQTFRKYFTITGLGKSAVEPGGKLEGVSLNNDVVWKSPVGLLKLERQSGAKPVGGTDQFS